MAGWNAARRQLALTLAAMVRMTALLFRIMPLRMATLTACEFGTAMLPIAQIYMTAELVAAAQSAIGQGGGYGRALTLLLGQAGLYWLQSCLDIANRFQNSRIKLGLMLHMGHRTGSKSTRLPLMRLESHELYDLQERVFAGLEHRGLQFFSSMTRIVQSVATLAGLIVVLLGFHPLLAVGLVLLVLPSLYIDIKESRFRFFQDVRQTPKKRKAEYFFGLLSNREWAKEIRIFGLSNHFLGQWKRLYRENGEEQLELERRMSWLKAGFATAWAAVFSLVGSLLLKLAASGRLGLPPFVALLQALSSVQGNLRAMSAQIAGIYELALYTQEWFDYLRMEEENEAGGQEESPFPLKQGIDVAGLAFRYPGAEQPALDGISFRVRPGEKVAIVGENGAGKSTLIKCLLGLYPTTAGRIAFDGIPVDRIDPNALRAGVAAIFQDFVQYQLSLKDNIAFGSLRHREDPDRLLEAAASSGADELASQLPHGFDTELGYRFLGGHELSYGQWQRIAISRAFFRNADILVLDEPTSALDPMAEAALFDRLADLSEGRTTFFTSHRLGICRKADLILVMKNGRIIEQGDHEALMDLQGEYARMFRTQAESYR